MKKYCNKQTPKSMMNPTLSLHAIATKHGRIIYGKVNNIITNNIEEERK
jgi:hypothetical protein